MRLALRSSPSPNALRGRGLLRKALARRAKANHESQVVVHGAPRAGNTFPIVEDDEEPAAGTTCLSFHFFGHVASDSHDQ